MLVKVELWDGCTADKDQHYTTYLEIESVSQYERLKNCLDAIEDGFLINTFITPLSCGVRKGFGKVYHEESIDYLLDCIKDYGPVFKDDDIN